jgi:8-oxo-dGTP pyrophosphatase MutT (NUDIX family)
MRFDDVVARLTRLPAELPPPPTVLLPTVVRAPSGSVESPPPWPSDRRAAAVLLLIYPDASGQATIVLTERQPGSHRHAGQISLPGGAIDGGEAVVEAALREAREEVGLDVSAAGVSVVGVLGPVDVRVSGFIVHPVVATAHRPPALIADAREVAAIIHAPLASFVPPAPIEIVTAERDGYLLRYGVYRLGERLVWGATAGILGRFGAFLASGLRPSRSGSASGRRRPTPPPAIDG